MSFLPVEMSALLGYMAPPLLGAFIGYLTNKVAIKMLFRPLKPWFLFGVKVPMTPGVIPSKRHDLAINIGEMVGEHLLTSKEIGTALARESFQKQLYLLIENRGGTILHKEYGPLTSLIPDKYKNYLNAAVQAITHQIQENLYSFIRSEPFTNLIENSSDEQFDRILNHEVDKFLTGEERELAYGFLEKSIDRMVSSPAMEEWITLFIQQKVYESLQQKKSLSQILPESFQQLIVQTIELQTPALLSKLADLLKEPAIRDKIVKGVCGGIENFISSMGPMAGMISSFISMETVEQKVQEYLVDKEEDIVNWLQNPEARERVAEVLRQRSQSFLDTPLAELIGENSDEIIGNFCNHFSRQLHSLLNEKETVAALTSMVKDNIETHIDSGKLPIREVLFDFVGESGLNKGRIWLKEEILYLLRSDQSRKTINAMVEQLLHDLLKRSIGRPSDLLPAGVRDGIYQSIRKMASNMLSVEVPGLVDSLNIRHIVAEKVDSLDLIRLERLLLSIMEEQFKYINLFGGFLGFLIGCLNLLFLKFL